MVHLPSWFPILFVLVVSAALSAVLIAVTKLLGPKRATAIKLAPFECGSESSGTARERFGVKFYVVALLFIVFDIEAVFLYPWAVLFQEMAWYGMVTMGIFAATLVLGLVYVWKKGALDWDLE